MLSGHSSFLLLVSGGPDSIYLFWQFVKWQKKYSFSFYVVYFNHGLRPAEAKIENAFIKKLCAQEGVKFFSEKLDLKGAKNIQNDARTLRYQKASKLAKKLGVKVLVTAHHLDDHLETLCMKKARNSGLRGLKGMIKNSSYQNLILWRPLLNLPKARILSSLKARKLDYCLDSSNLKSAYFRNRVRDFLNKNPISKSEKKNINALTSSLFLMDEYFKSETKNLCPLGKIFLPHNHKAHQSPEIRFRVFCKMIRHCKLKREFLKNDFQRLIAQRGLFTLGQGGVLHSEMGFWFLKSLAQNPFQVLIHKTGAYYFGALGYKIVVKKVKTKNLDLKTSRYFSKSIEWPLTLKTGDLTQKLMPYGSHSLKSVKKIFQNHKIHKFIRAQWPVLMDAKHQAVLIPHVKVTQNASVSPKDTWAYEVSALV